MWAATITPPLLGQCDPDGPFNLTLTTTECDTGWWLPINDVRVKYYHRQEWKQVTMKNLGGTPRGWHGTACNLLEKPSQFEVWWFTSSQSDSTRGIGKLEVEYCCHPGGGCTP